MNNLLHIGLSETRHAFRMLRHNYIFTLSLLCLLIITIGAFTTLGVSAYELLSGSLPYGKANELAMVWSDLPKSGYLRAPLSGPELSDLRERSQKFSDFAAIASSTTTLGRANDPLQISIGTVTYNFFSVLQVMPQYGRAFTANDEGDGKPPTVILSWNLWKNRFGGDPSIVGRKIQLHGSDTEVIGVMPSSFRMIFAPDANIPETTEAWVPFGSNLKEINRNRYFLRVVGRLRGNNSPEVASREVAAIGASLEKEFVTYASSGRRMFVIGLGADLAQPVKVSANALGFAGLFLITLCFVNIAGLWMTRAIRRRHQHSIYQILGASVVRLRIQIILQAVMLITIGSALGIAAGQLGLVALRYIRPPSLARIDHATITWPVLLVIIAIVVILTLLLITVSWFSINPFDSSEVTRTRMSSGIRYRFRASLVITQVALTFIFLICSVLWTRSLLNVLQTDLGFQPKNALTFRYSINPLGLREDAQLISINKQLNDAINSIPGIEASGSISHLPFDRLPNWSMSYWAEEADKSKAREADSRPVSPGLLNALGARVLAGRFFQESDSLNAPQVIVVDKLLANRTWPGENPLGKRLFVEIRSGSPPITFTVIGILEHLRYRTVEGEIREQLYIPVRQYPGGPYALIARSSLSLKDLDAAIHQKVREVDPRIPIWDIRSLNAYYDDATAERSFAAIMLVIFAIAALLLASIGVFSLLIFIVDGRQLEFGIRMALGEPSKQIVFTVLSEGLLWALIAILISGAFFIPIATKLSSALYGVKIQDPLSWIISSAILLIAIIIANWIPAIRVSRITPSTLMRNQ